MRVLHECHNADLNKHGVRPFIFVFAMGRLNNLR
jgi:hypothetical protein